MDSAFIGKDQEAMHTKFAQSWQQLQELLFEDSWNSDISRFRAPFVYRGLANHNFTLKTSLMRLEGDYPSLEKHLLRNFIKYGHDSFHKSDSIWHWLTLAQHHGLPTRLLDWTYSPLVALHFATSDLTMGGQDGVIWKVNYHNCLDIVPDKLASHLECEGSSVFTMEMLSKLVDSLLEFQALDPEEFFIFFEPPSINPRIVNQYALFSIASNATTPLDLLLEKHKVDTTQIIIPRELKWEIRDKLDQSNITERVLFPGLDGLSAWLKRHYSPSS